MKLTRKHVRYLKKLRTEQKRNLLKQIAINNKLTDMYLDCCLFTDQEIEQIFEKVLFSALEDIQNGGK